MRLTRLSCVLQALVMKVGMDSIMASYFALFEVINHSFGEICVCSPFLSVCFFSTYPNGCD